MLLFYNTKTGGLKTQIIYNVHKYSVGDKILGKTSDLDVVKDRHFLCIAYLPHK